MQNIRSKKGESALQAVVLIVIAVIGLIVIANYFGIPIPGQVTTPSAPSAPSTPSTPSTPASCGSQAITGIIGPVKVAYVPSTSLTGLSDSYYVNDNPASLTSIIDGSSATFGANQQVTVIYSNNRTEDTNKNGGTDTYYSGIVKDIPVGCSSFYTNIYSPDQALIWRPGNLTVNVKAWDTGLIISGVNTSFSGANTNSLTLNDDKNFPFQIVAPAQRAVGPYGKIWLSFHGQSNIYKKIILTGTGFGGDGSCPVSSTTDSALNTTDTRWCYYAQGMKDNQQLNGNLEILTLPNLAPSQGNNITLQVYPEDVYFNTQTYQWFFGVEDNTYARVGFQSPTFTIAG